MVGFGEFLRRTCAHHYVSDQVIDYNALKSVLTRVTRVRSQSFDSREQLGSESPGEHSDDGSEAVGSGLTSPEPRDFVDKLEAELQRIDDVVARRLIVIRRAHCVVETAKALRSRRLERELGVTLTQLVNAYDDVVLLLWFMYLNAIGASKIVKKYNKNVPSEPYVVEPNKWFFLGPGLAHAQNAKAMLEEEYGRCPAPAGGEGDEDLLHASDDSRSLADEISTLMQDNKKHLNMAQDPTQWACNPILDGMTGAGVGDVSEAAERRKKETARLRGTATGRFRFSVSDPRIIGKYFVDGVVGRGAYGVVSRLTQRSTRRPFALKTIRSVWSHPVLAQRIYRETLIMLRLSHPHILRVEEVLTDINRHDVHIVMPFIPHTVEDLLSRHRLLPAHKRWFALQLLDGLAYMHGRGVVHRDLKPPNLLVDDVPRLFISDFGLARTVGSNACCSGTRREEDPEYAQTQWYRAPEILLCQHDIGFCADIWSVGCIVAELLTGVPLFPGQDPQHQLELILACRGDQETPLATAFPVAHPRRRTTRVPRPAALPPARRGLSELLECCWRAGRQPDTAADYDLASVLNLLSGLLTLKPPDRLTAAAATQHPWFADLQAKRSGHARATDSGEELMQLPLGCGELRTASEYLKSLEDCLGAERARKAEELRQRQLTRQEQECGCDEAGCSCVLM